MKKYLTLAMAVYVLFSWTGSRVSADDEESIVEEIMAKVGGKIITRTDFNKRKEQVLLEMKEFMDDTEYEKNLPDLDKKVLNDLINEALIEQKASEYAISVPESAIDEAIEKLKEENKIKTPEQFGEALASIGMTEEELRQNMRNRFLKNSLLEQEVKSKIILTQTQIENYYEEHKEEYRILPSVKIRQIFFRSDQMSRDEILEECSKIKGELQGGGDFSEISLRYADPDTVAGGGILGPFNQDDLIEEIKDAAFSLEIGQVSDVIETEYGFYIIQVVERDAGGYKSLPEVSEEIKDKIYRKMASEGIEEYIKKLKDEIFVEVLSES